MFSEPVLAYWAKVDQEGRLVVPQELTTRYGLEPGAELRIDGENAGLYFHQPITNLAKIYIEPTNLCNLNCRTCMRNAWEEPVGRMKLETFARIIEGLQAWAVPPTVSFSGIGEPLFHPDIVTMVTQAKRAGCRVELITNGTLLDAQISQGLIEAGLDLLWVSLDGATPESYADIRLGAALPHVLHNVENFYTLRRAAENHVTKIGIVFVAMNRNIADLPGILRLTTRLGVSRIFISNVLPYTEDMCTEVLYSRSLSKTSAKPSRWAPHLYLPRIDTNNATREALFYIGRGGYHLSHNGVDSGGGINRCPFIVQGSAAVAWDGSLSPCLPLMHNHESYLEGRPYHSRRFVVGSLAEHNLDELWKLPVYLDFRKRVQEFDFSPCTMCGGCDLSETNEEDCCGNTFPTCGGCLWAQGVIQCP